MLERLRELARELELEVRSVRGPAVEDGLPTTSAICRVYGATFVVLSSSDAVEDQIAVLAEALRAHAPLLLEERFLPPAVRECLARRGRA